MLQGSNFSKAFKESFGEKADSMKSNINMHAEFFSSLDVSSVKPSQRGIYTPSVMANDEAGGASNETEAFPQAGNITVENPIIYDKMNRYNFEISDKMLEFGRLGDKITFANSLLELQKNKQAVAAKDIERQVFGNGLGTITLVNGAVSASATVVVDMATLLRPSMVIDIYATIGGSREAQARTILTVVPETNTITLDLPITCSDNAVVCRTGVLDAYPTEGKELTGIQKMVDTTTNGNNYLGVSRVTYPQWRGNVVSPSATDVSDDLLQQLHDRISKIGGSSPDTLISNNGQWRMFKRSEINKTRFEPGTIKAGTTKLMWGDLNWVRNIDYPTGEVAMLSKKEIKKYQTRDIHLMDEDGAPIARKGGFPIYEGAYIYYGNIATLKPNAHGRLLNLNEPSF